MYPAAIINVLTLRRFQSRKEILEERVVNPAALRVILHSERERIFAQANLLNNAIVRGPGFHFQILAQAIDCLVMRAVHFWKTVRCAARTAQWLNIAFTLMRQVVAFDIEL